MDTLHRSETRPRWQMPRLDNDDRWLAGVASGMANEIGVQPIVIRASFIVLVAAGGWGAMFYIIIGLFMAWTTARAEQAGQTLLPPTPKAATVANRHYGVAMIVLGLLFGIRLVNIGFIDAVVWPASFVFMGALIAWSHSRDSEEGMSTVARSLAGVAVGVGGLLAFAAFSFDLQDAVLALIFAVAVVAGIAVIAAPSLLRMVNALEDERRERVRADERAQLAVHLHDSVLQTLSLIQRHAHDPATTSQLARRQERELRNWLYETPGPEGSVKLRSALNDLAIKIEANHGVPVEVVVVGDVAMEASVDARFKALLGATGEAATNAAKHSGASQVDVFAELKNGHAEIFVRDTGNGFDLADVSPDRKGIANSIQDRMERHGGSATIHSTVGEGTEVELRLQLTDPTNADPTQTAAAP